MSLGNLLWDMDVFKLLGKVSIFAQYFNTHKCTGQTYMCRQLFFQN